MLFVVPALYLRVHGDDDRRLSQFNLHDAAT
jgi:hypothetical protein